MIQAFVNIEDISSYWAVLDWFLGILILLLSHSLTVSTYKRNISSVKYIERVYFEIFKMILNMIKKNT